MSLMVILRQSVAELPMTYLVLAHYFKYNVPSVINQADIAFDWKGTTFVTSQDWMPTGDGHSDTLRQRVSHK